MKKLYSDPDMKISEFTAENAVVTSGVVQGKEVTSAPDGYETKTASYNIFGFVFN